MAFEIITDAHVDTELIAELHPVVRVAAEAGISSPPEWGQLWPRANPDTTSGA